MNEDILTCDCGEWGRLLWSWWLWWMWWRWRWRWRKLMMMMIVILLWKLSSDESYNSWKKWWLVTFRLWRCFHSLLFLQTLILHAEDDHTIPYQQGLYHLEGLYWVNRINWDQGETWRTKNNFSACWSRLTTMTMRTTMMMVMFSVKVETSMTVL